MAKKDAVVVDAATGTEMTAVAGIEVTGDGSGVALPLAEPEGGWPADEYTGKGGSYVRDPFTGVRTPTPETAAALAAATAQG